MSMYTLLRNKPVPKMEDIETYFQVSHNEWFNYEQRYQYNNKFKINLKFIPTTDLCYREIYVVAPDIDQF